MFFSPDVALFCSCSLRVVAWRARLAWAGI